MDETIWQFEDFQLMAVINYELSTFPAICSDATIKKIKDVEGAMVAVSVQ